MMNRSLLRDISRDELLQMRADGMSNAAIAKSLDISYNTVLKMIGKQPKENREPPRMHYPDVIPGADDIPEKDKEPEEPGSILLVEAHCVRLVGMASNYSIDSTNIWITPEEGSERHETFVTWDELPVFIEELKMILKHKDQMTAKNEQW